MMPIPPPAEKTFPVAVTNNSGKELVGYFDGEKHVFHVKRTLTVENNVARHILGYGLPDKTNTVIALGWSITHKDMPEALARLAKFTFDPAEGTPHAMSPVREQVPLASSKSEAGGKLLTPAA